MNQLLLLLGERPGALQKQLQASEKSLMSGNLPALQLGIPSEVALNRPDIRAAEAKLHSSTARIGVAQAELYPGITLGARIGIDTYSADNFTEWGSRIQSRQALAMSQRDVMTAWAAVNRAVGNYPR